MKKILTVIIINCFFWLSGQNKDFIVFNALLYKNTPELESYGYHDIFLFYEDELLDKNFKKSSNGNLINYSKIKAAALKASNEPNIPVCLDIESWKLDDHHRVASKSKYIKVLKYFKKYNSKSKVGYFGVFPMDSPHADYSFKSPIRESVIMPKWHESNNFVKNIGRESLIYFPVFYTRMKDVETWEKIVLEKVSKIKEVNKTAKIYGFIWPQYYTDDGLYKFIEPDVWKRQLQTIYKNCDGVVIWSHYLGNNGKPIEFSYEMEWFKITNQFIKDKGIK